MIPIDVILEAACLATGATPEVIRGRSRLQEVVAQRRFIAKKMRDEGYSYPRIGQALGGRDHATIMHLVGWVPPKKLAPWRNKRWDYRRGLAAIGVGL